MMGRNHVIAGVSAVTGTVALLSAIAGAPRGFAPGDVLVRTMWQDLYGVASSMGFSLGSAPWLAQLNDFFAQGAVSGTAGVFWAYLFPAQLRQPWVFGYLVVSLILLVLGCVLPDIDTKGSMLGRHLRVPGPHHGFTHTDWFALALFLLSVPVPFRPLVFLWLGVFTHHVFDALSAAGRVPFYPIQRHRQVPLPDGGVLVVPYGYHRGYVTGSRAETLLVFVVVALSACCVAWALFMWRGGFAPFA